MGTTSFEREGRISRVEVRRFASKPVNSIAPNGSATSVDYYTAIVYKETWSDDPRNGIYIGLSYMITERYISTSPSYIGQYLGSDSRPWEENLGQGVTILS